MESVMKDEILHFLLRYNQLDETWVSAKQILHHKSSSIYGENNWFIWVNSDIWFKTVEDYIKKNIVLQ